MMVKWAYDGLLQANDGKMLVNDDGEVLVNDGEMSVWSNMKSFLYPEILRIENANIFFPHKYGKLFTQSNTLEWPQKC